MGLIDESFEDFSCGEVELKLVVKRTFLEEVAGSGNGHDGDSVECYRGRRGRAFTDSAIEYGSPRRFSADSLDTTTTTGTSSPETDTSSASSSIGDSREVVEDVPPLPAFDAAAAWTTTETAGGPTYCFVPMMGLQTSFAGLMPASPATAQQTQELNSTVTELNNQAAQLMAKAQEAEKAAQLIRVKAKAPWRRAPSGGANDVVVARPVQSEMPMAAMPWMPVFYFPTSVPAPVHAVPVQEHALAACQLAGSQQWQMGQSPSQSTGSDARR